MRIASASLKSRSILQVVKWHVFTKKRVRESVWEREKRESKEENKQEKMKTEKRNDNKEKGQQRKSKNKKEEVSKKDTQNCQDQK